MGDDRLRVTAILAGLALALALAPAPAMGSNDPSYGKQWGFERIGAPAAWTRTTGTGVPIGIVDTGTDLAHEDLAGRVVAHTSCIDSGGDAARCSGSAQDDHGHGTHVAGIAAATTDNGRGVAGVGRGAELVVAKTFSSSGSAELDDVLAGIRWVVDHGARVVNLSLGDIVFVSSATFGSPLAEGVDYAWSHGAVPVVSSGNDDLFGLGIGSAEYGNLNALVVGATGPDDRVAAYSSPTGNAKWALVAPGGAGDGVEEHDIFSTFWAKGKTNQYAYLVGTSMAAPHVTGAVALLLAQGYGQQAAVDRLLATVDTAVPCGPNSPTCKGRLDIARATAP